eukprot:TRINITY_DN25904_c0_g1_i1.p1 TRINITY_DN25904_c0_g1~~TRINITY_DN25904_c0_g1_i1.p1  ORF type:complete len:577 (-),score=95.80 TRINITY_DN25904_c0_g1_i1:229-1959(-)
MVPMLAALWESHASSRQALPLREKTGPASAPAGQALAPAGPARQPMQSLPARQLSGATVAGLHVASFQTRCDSFVPPQDYAAIFADAHEPFATAPEVLCTAPAPQRRVLDKPPGLPRSSTAPRSQSPLRQRRDCIDMRQFLASPESPPVREERDILHLHVQRYLRTHPKVAERHSVLRKRPGVYSIDGHEVQIEWQHMSVPTEGFLLAIDGPLKQPLADYMKKTQTNAVYDTGDVAKTAALHHVPKDKRMTFDDKDKRYGRLQAMRVAKEQALIRERAASLVNDGQNVAIEDLAERYRRNIQRKLGGAKEKKKDKENADPTSNLARPPASKAGIQVQVEQVREPMQEPSRDLLVPSERTPVATARQHAPMQSPMQQQSMQPPLAVQQPQPGSYVPPAQVCAARPAWAAVAPRGMSLNGLPVGPVPLLASSGGGYTTRLPTPRLYSSGSTPAVPAVAWRPPSYVPPPATTAAGSQAATATRGGGYLWQEVGPMSARGRSVTPIRAIAAPATDPAAPQSAFQTWPMAAATPSSARSRSVVRSVSRSSFAFGQAVMGPEAGMVSAYPAAAVTASIATAM